MEFKLIWLIVLPLSARAAINIEINSSDEAKPQISFHGETVDLISEDERTTFHISDSQLKEACKKYSGGEPTDVFIGSPTPWGDLYKTYGWKQVRRIIKPLKVKVISVTNEPVIVSRNIFTNNGSQDSTYNADMSQSVERTVTSSWRKGGLLTTKAEVNYSVLVKPAPSSESLSFSFSTSWGNSTSTSETVSISSSSGVKVALKPGQSAEAALTVNRGTMEIQVEYTAVLDGKVAVNYYSGYKGHHFWSYNVNAVLTAAGLPTSVGSVETVKVGFYADAKVDVSDLK